MKNTSFSTLIFLIVFNHSIERTMSQTSDSINIGETFIPAGYMGCPGNITIDRGWSINPKSPPVCFKCTYPETCPSRYAGVYWTNIADPSGANWGQHPGQSYSIEYSRIVFWARGEKGGEIIEFGAFGINNPQQNPDRFPFKDNCHKVTISDGFVVLTKTWTRYIINLTCKNFTSVIGGFYWSASWDSNPSGLTFYLDDIKLLR